MKKRKAAYANILELASEYESDLHVAVNWPGRYK